MSTQSCINIIITLLAASLHLTTAYPIIHRYFSSASSLYQYKPDSLATTDYTIAPITRRKAFQSLESHSFVKIICGASNNDVSLIRNLCFIYTLAGCDCIDISIDEAVIKAATEGINSAMMYGNLAKPARPILMVSVNDHDDPHFRKALFDPALCPSHCPRPCERVCPALAIPPLSAAPSSGVIEDKCYGCGRCVPVCPLGLIHTQSYTVDRATIRRFLSLGLVEAIEIHTQLGHEDYFEGLWRDIGLDVLGHALILAVSFPGRGADTLPFLNRIQSTIASSPVWDSYAGVQIWQADGKPMSGDIGKGTARAACELGKDILANGSQGEGFNIGGKSSRQYVQLAGGTNNHSVVIAREMELTSKRGFGGFAFGGFARKKLCADLSTIEEDQPGALVEHHQELLLRCLEFAKSFIGPIKQ